MDYKEKVIALLNNQELSKEQKEKLENIFPELAENEDERIRKGLVKAVSGTLKGNTLYGTDVTREEALAWLEKQCKQKSADKVEPKFHEDDWIVFNGLILHIDEVVNGYYRTTSRGDGIHNSYDWDIDNAARLWTIQDAKDGDVLNSSSHRLIWIYKDNERYHVCVNMNYVTENIAIDSFIKIPSDACPATKDERAILFEKMKEEGYKWDAEKKELKKIETKTLYADKVIAWIVANICDFEYYVTRFKKDFGL